MTAQQAERAANTINNGVASRLRDLGFAVEGRASASSYTFLKVSRGEFKCHVFVADATGEHKLTCSAIAVERVQSFSIIRGERKTFIRPGQFDVYDIESVAKAVLSKENGYKELLKAREQSAKLDAEYAARKAAEEAPSREAVQRLGVEFNAIWDDFNATVQRSGGTVGLNISQYSKFTEDQARQILSLIASFKKKTA
jgi:hypothetical protein